MAVTDPLIGKRIGHFRLIERLGAGGMGVVYRAADEALHRDVAIKVLPESALHDPGKRARFLREARSAAAVAHSCIAAVHAVEESEDGAIHLVMELVEGRSLRALLNDRDVLPEAQAVHIATEIARGLARAHAAGIVHRDLKPENVMVSDDDEVKILDFGLAKIFTSDTPPATGDVITPEVKTREGAILGTPEYMAPEQARGAPVDARADVYALGVMLFEMIAGRRPFEDETPLGTIAKVLIEPVPPLEQASPWLAELVLRCLAKSPAERPNDGLALRDALRAKGSSVGPTPTTSSIDPVKSVKELAETLSAPSEVVQPTPTKERRRAWPRILAVALLAVVAGGALIAWIAIDGTSGHEPRVRPPSVSNAVSNAPPPALVATRVELPRGISVQTAAIMADGARVVLAAHAGVEIREIAGLGRERVQLPEGFHADFVTPIDRSDDVVVSGQRADGTWAVLRASVDRAPIVLREGASLGALSPDGNMLAAIERGRLIVVPADGGVARELLDRAAGAVWLPGGRALAALGTRPRNRLVHVGLDGSTTPLLGLDIQSSLQALPAVIDAETLLVTVADPEILGARLCRLALSDPQHPRCFATLPLAEPGMITLDRAHRRGAIVWRFPATGLSLASLRGDRLEDVRRLDAGDGNYRPYAWIDDTTLLVGANRRGRWEVLAWEIDGHERVLASFPGVDVMYPSPAPDGDGIFAIWMEGEPDALGLIPWSVVRIRDGVRVETISAPRPGGVRVQLGRPMPNAALTCSADACVLGTVDGDQFVLEDPRAGEPIARLPTRGQNDMRLSPDGRVLWLGNQGSLTAFDLATREERVVELEPDAYVQYVDVLADGTLFVSTVGIGNEQSIRRIAPDGTVTVLLRSTDDWYAHPLVSPDGTRIVYAERAVASDAISIFELPPED